MAKLMKAMFHGTHCESITSVKSEQPNKIIYLSRSPFKYTLLLCRLLKKLENDLPNIESNEGNKQLVYAAISHLIVSKSLLLQIKEFLKQDPRFFFSFRKDNEAEKGNLVPTNGHCFSTFILAFSNKYRIRLINKMYGS